MSKAYDKIAEQLLAMTDEAGNWTPCWHKRGLTIPKNAITGRKYSGFNVLALWCGGAGFTLPLWATYRQWAEVGAQVARGSKGTPITFYSLLDKDDGTKQPISRTFTVFNRDQVVNPPPLDQLPVNPDDRMPEVEVFIGSVKQHADIEERTDCDVPCYIPSMDKILMPTFDAFHHAEGYYGTLLHELTHWTGHASREDRKFSQERSEYAFEELVAELGACFLAADLGIEAEPRPDHAQYLKHWHKLLKQDPGLFAQAAALARKASARIHALTGEPA